MKNPKEYTFPEAEMDREKSELSTATQEMRDQLKGLGSGKVREIPEVDTEEKQELFRQLALRCSQHFPELNSMDFMQVQEALEASPEALYALSRMEATGGAPALFRIFEDKYRFTDSSPESPVGRRNMDFSEVQQQVREFCAHLLSYADYQTMQEQRPLDRESSSWIATSHYVLKEGHAMDVNAEDFAHMPVKDRHPSKGWRGYVDVLRKK